MGEVHRAYDTRRQRWVALKRLSPAIAEDAEVRERFDRECRVAARLASPHVVPIHDFGVIDGRPFLDMRLIAGRDLGRVLLEEGPLAPDRAVTIIEQLADALDAAHADGLVHRDVKPGNALVTAQRDRDFVHLVDFGIVRLVQDATAHRLTEVGTAIGTLTYMAPEQIEDATVDSRADVYALAVVLYEALTGRPPFAGDMPQVLHQHLTVAPTPPSVVRPELPPALDAVVLRGMAKQPGDRFDTTGAFAGAARAAVDGAPPRLPPGPSPSPLPPGPEHDRPTLAGPVPEGEPPVPGGRHRRGLWIGLGAVALVVAVAVAATLVVVLGRTDDTPITIATGVQAPLVSSFPDVAAGGCGVGNPESSRTNSGVMPEEVRRCTRLRASVSYVRWPTPADASARVSSYRSSPSLDGRQDWSTAGAVQGPYQQTLAAGQCTIVAAWTGLPQLVQVYAPGDRCDDVSATFGALALPSGDALRSLTSVFVASAEPGCGPTSPRPNASGATPRESRRCTASQGATVTWSRWATAAEVADEANARRAAADGGPTAWTATDGRPQGSYVQTEEGGTCQVLLGWDAAPYSAEVVAPDCDLANRVVAVLAPPAAADLPG